MNKVGDARVGLVGFPSVGKSTLLNKLTGTFSEVGGWGCDGWVGRGGARCRLPCRAGRRVQHAQEESWDGTVVCVSIKLKRSLPCRTPPPPLRAQVASYEFTTLTCIPGVIRYRGAKIQLLDLPGIIEGAKDGKGRGRQVIATARTCNLIIIVLDCLKPITHKKLIEHELEGGGRGGGGVDGAGGAVVEGRGGHKRRSSSRRGRCMCPPVPPPPTASHMHALRPPPIPGFGIRLNKKPPEITFKKKDKGGVNFTSTLQNPKVDLDGESPGRAPSTSRSRLCKPAAWHYRARAPRPCLLLTPTLLPATPPRTPPAAPPAAQQL